MLMTGVSETLPGFVTAGQQSIIPAYTSFVSDTYRIKQNLPFSH
jgi:hypothetical protein